MQASPRASRSKTLPRRERSRRHDARRGRRVTPRFTRHGNAHPRDAEGRLTRFDSDPFAANDRDPRSLDVARKRDERPLLVARSTRSLIE
jgi:hypothetical protein